MMNIEGLELNLYLSSDVIIKPPLLLSTVSITLAFMCFNGLSIYLMYIRIYDILLNTPLFLLLFKCVNYPSMFSEYSFLTDSTTITKLPFLLCFYHQYRMKII